MEEIWIPLSRAVKLTAQRLGITDRMARTLLLKEAFPSGVGFGGDKVVERYELEQTGKDAGPLSLIRRWRTPESHFTEIDPKTLVHGVIAWNEETINFPPGTLSKRPHHRVRLRVNADDLEAWLKLKGDMLGERKTDSVRPSATASRGGRPPRYDRDEFIREVVRRANTPDGLPDRPTLTKQMAQWCVDNWQDPPCDSLLRDWIAKAYPN
jgi:hypothetical protein